MSNLLLKDLETINVLLDRAERVLDNVKTIRLDFQKYVFNVLSNNNEEKKACRAA